MYLDFLVVVDFLLRRSKHFYRAKKIFGTLIFGLKKKILKTHISSIITNGTAVIGWDIS